MRMPGKLSALRRRVQGQQLGLIKKWRNIPHGIRWIMGMAAAGIFCYVVIPVPNPLFPKDYSHVIFDESQKILRVFLNTQEQWILPPDPRKAIPHKLKQAVLSYEDKDFYRHRGISPSALMRAFYLNLRYKKVMSGASTLTMQVARMMTPKSRTYPNKLLEMAQTLKIETHYSKDEILRLYLDHAPYGGNIRGYQAAAWKYFGKSAEALTWAEAATLAVLPNSPALITPVVNRQKLIRKRNVVLKTLWRQKHINQSAYELARAEPAPGKILHFPVAAPHATRWLMKRQPGTFRIETTLNRDIQALCREIVRRHTLYLRPYGIKNICLLAAETKTGKVRAYIGSQDFHDHSTQGKVDGVQAPRSSGSILKPFLYALAMDEGLLLPDMQMKDIPTHFKGFSPQNYTKIFQGVVSAREALIKSLNVPAVRLLNYYGVYSFCFFLKSSGVRTLFRAAEEYGLALILGGAEVTLWDMVALYRGLGQQGRFQPLQLLKDGSRSKAGPGQLIHPASCHLVLDILKAVKRPGSEYYWEQFNNQRPIAWKTGTSYGSRDAWAIGTSPQWTIGVWVGNFTGEGNANLSGARCAGPLLFDCFNALPHKPGKTWFEEPVNQFTSCEICRHTGFMAAENCPDTKMMLIPWHHKPFRRCPYHKVYYMDKNKTHTVCSRCWDSNNHSKEVRLVYPPNIMHFMRKQGHRISKIPPHNPKCPSINTDQAMDVVYPLERAKIWIPRGLDEKLQKLIIQVTHRDRQCRIFWYLDGKYIGETRDRHDKAIQTTTGWHTVEVVDENGEQIKRRFQIVIRGKNAESK